LFAIYFNSDTDAVLLTVNLALEVFVLTILKIFHH
jgi:membrane-associated phospholipid phosphatase